ncbi:MAG: hypothetical protein FJZ64_03845 [Chlamydiae bacterium]|nr:hypothetical protein [Chlamydiota bacterium]
MRVSLSQEVRSAAAIEKAVNQKNLTLKRCDELANQIFEKFANQEVAIPLLQRVEQRRQELVQRQVERLDKSKTPLARLELLIPIIGDLDPDEAGERLEAIRLEAEMSGDPKILQAVRRQLEHVHFAEKKPIVKDLSEFTRRVGNIAKAVMATQTFDPLRAFNKTQRQQLEEAQ